MADQTPSKSPTQGKPDDSPPTTGQDIPDLQDDTNSQEDQDVETVREQLAREEPGTFNDGDNSSFDLIEDENGFERYIGAYERLKNTGLSADDLTSENPIITEWIEPLVQAMTTCDDAMDTKTPKGRTSTAVNRIKRMKKFEMVLVAWRVARAVRDAQSGRGPGVLGDKNQSPEKFESSDDRLLGVISVLMVWKNAVINLIDNFEKHGRLLAASPHAAFQRMKSNRKTNDAQAKVIAIGRKMDESKSSTRKNQDERVRETQARKLEHWNQQARKTAPTSTSHPSTGGTIQPDMTHKKNKSGSLSKTLSLTSSKRPYSIHAEEALSRDDERSDQSSSATTASKGHKRQKLDQREGGTALYLIEYEADDEEGDEEGDEEEYEDEYEEGEE